jgi:PAS domain S-box-containing protein
VRGKMNENKKEILKELIRQLHSGTPPAEVKEKFKQVLKDVSSTEIARIEDELVKEGMPREELQRLCNVHLEVFREQLEKEKTQMEISPENPVNILMEEHKILLRFLEEMDAIVKSVQQADDSKIINDVMPQLKHIAEDFLDTEKHYLREENVLFPILEKHGVSEPPAIMWTEHTKLREQKKRFHKLIEDYDKMSFEDFKGQLCSVAGSLYEILSSHIFKENNILFPTALQVVTEQEWKDARKEFDEIGYCCFTPEQLTKPLEGEMVEKSMTATVASSEGTLQFETGSLSREEIEAILDTLPIDISFVGKDDAVKYFNKAEERIFVRSKSVIGRKVQLCHPQKSINIVNNIVESFKKGEKDNAEFWINLNNRLVHIRYFAVRDKNGKYLGTMEVTQDLTDIKKIEGEKRLLDWKS